MLQSTCCTSHRIENHKDPFRPAIQRHPKARQAELAVEQAASGSHDTYAVNDNIYRTIATAQEGSSAKAIKDWHSQGCETSEN